MNKKISDPGANSLNSEQNRKSFFDLQTGAFFRKVDWAAFWTVLIISFSLYLYTLAPTVTLEDSGELTVAADHMGVPHPPGYPTWTLLAWLFQWLFQGIEYHGYPNPAWAVGLMSAVFASLACAILALLVIRSAADIMRGIKREALHRGSAGENLMYWTAGVTAGLTLAFSPVLWSQAVIVEVYALNAFFLMIILMLIYRWMSRPGERYILFVIAYMFGLALTNHHTILFVAPALLLAAALRDLRLFRDGSVIICVLTAGIFIYQAWSLTTGPGEPAHFTQNLYYFLGLFFLLVPAGLYFIERRIFTEWRKLGLIALFGLLGISFYLYMPLASEQNPPHNWGNTRTWEGFIRTLTRGQYERIVPANPFSDPGNFLEQVRAYFISLRGQFTLPSILMAVLPFFFLRRIHRSARAWLFTMLTAYFFVSVMLIMFLNPDLDIQTLFIQRRFFIPSHALYAVWLGYSIAFGLFLLDRWLGRTRFSLYIGMGLAATLPLSILYQNFHNEEQVKIIGGAEQRGHDFGWQFGHWQLRGSKAILEELDPTERSLPNPEYPPEMERGAILFGGTDPGRFVPTYMIFSARCRQDIYLITQNALADNTYMAVMRDLYGDEIWIPSRQDSNMAFRQYVEQVQAGRIPHGSELTIQEDGRIHVRGIRGVMMINNILSREIFENNRHRHQFYVEESYVIPWMLPYLEPHGLILKLNSEPVEITSEMVKNDREFWDWYTARLLNDPRFIRDIVARKSFSKLRSAIAGIYDYREMFDEAEYAFKQAIELYPLSPETSIRLADMYMRNRRYSDAAETITGLLEKDPGNIQGKQFLERVRNSEQLDRRRLELERLRDTGQMDLNTALELAGIYHQLQLHGRFEQHTMNLLSNDRLPAQAFLHIGQLAADAGRLDMLETALRRYLELEPRDHNIWLEMAAIQTALDKHTDAIRSLRRAIEAGGDAARNMARQDNRFDVIRNRPEFRQLVPSINDDSRFLEPVQ